MQTSRTPFVSGETLVLIYPELAAQLHDIPSRIEDKRRVYNAFIALDVVNALRKQAIDLANVVIPPPVES
jgi:hypothetical protein